MTFRVTHVKWISVVVVLAALVAPTAATAGKPEAKQIAAYLSGVLPPKGTPAESGRAEAKQIAAYLSGVMHPRSNRPTPAESSRAETKAFANFMQLASTEAEGTVARPGGFDWGDAAIGAAITVGLVLLLGALGAGVVISRRQVPST